MPQGRSNRKPSMKDTKRLNGSTVRFIRQMRKLSQDSLAQKAGLDPSSVSRYEKGSGYASMEAMAKIAAALEVDLDVITYPVYTVTEIVTREPAA